MYSFSQLPYAYDALEPFISRTIMELHHTKHHQAYINGLNNALEKHPTLLNVPLVELLKDLNQVPDEIRIAVRNHGGGVENHSFFWELMKPQGANQPRGIVGQLIKKQFGTIEAFKNQFETAAKGCFGSGWAWLSLDTNGELVVSITANQDSPYSVGLNPLMGLDVWEHAYYLQYFNRRADYISAWWNILNWDQVEENYEKFRG